MDNHLEHFTLRTNLWTVKGIIIFFLEAFFDLLRHNKKMLFLSILSFCTVAWYVYAVIAQFIHFQYITSVASFIISVIVYFLLLMGTTIYYFSCYRIECTVCIRDEIARLWVSQLVSCLFIPIGLHFVLISFFTAYIASHIVYQKVVVPKKQPDLKVVAEHSITADSDKYLGAKKLLKISFNNELRECIELHSGESMPLYLTDCDKLAIGIASREFGRVPLELTIEEVAGNDKKIAVFKKQFNPRNYFRDRRWNDLVLDLSKDGGNKKPRELVFTLKGPRLSHIYLSLKKKKAVAKKSDIYILIIDGLRSECLNNKGLLSDKHAHLTQCFRESVIYPYAFSQGAWTLPTLGSILTSLYPVFHGVNHPYLNQRLPMNAEVLPELLSKNGYHTYGFVTGPRTSPQYGYSRGFDKYLYAICDKEYNKGTISQAIEWIQEQDLYLDSSDNRFFYIHLIDTHTPFYPPRYFEWKFNMFSSQDVVRDVKKYKRKGKKVEFSSEELELYKKLYEAEVDHVFWKLDCFLMYLKGKGLYENSTIVVAGDHGINFTEHRSINVFDLYREYVHVAFAVKYPSSIQKKGICNDLVSVNLDMLPTVAEAAGIDIQNKLHGKNLTGDITIRDFVISEDLYKNSYAAAIRTKRHTFIYRTQFDSSSFANFMRNNESFELYDLDSDASEKNNVFSNASSAIKTYFLGILNNHINEALKFGGINKIVDIDIN